MIVISGPSGVGKTTILHKILEDPRYQRVITTTTRKPRGAEQNGVDYHFVSREAFEKGVEGGSFLEWARVHGNLYGSTLIAVEAIRRAGRVPVAVIDVQGARAIRNKLPSVQFFILPPNIAALVERLQQRGEDSSEDIQRRLQIAEDEIACKGEFNYILVNNDVAIVAQTIKELSHV